jgi:ribonuclease HI
MMNFNLLEQRLVDLFVEIPAIVAEVAVHTEPVGMVLYTDGGSKPLSNGQAVGGWGMHGYIYSSDKPKKGQGNKGFSILHDGYLNGKEEPQVTVLRYIDAFQNLEPHSTNNEAELASLYYGLRMAKALGIKKLSLILDSRYVLEGATQYRFAWRKQDWCKKNGEPVANRALWMLVGDLLDEMAKEVYVLKWSWTKGHSDSVGNNKADECATLAVIAASKHLTHQTLKFSDPQGYWSRTVTANRMMAESRWYFAPHLAGQMIGERTVYYIGQHGKEDDTWGKPEADRSMAVVAMEHADPVMETVRNYMGKHSRGSLGQVCICRLDQLYKPDIYDQIADHGDTFIKPTDGRLDLFTSNKDLLVRHIEKPRLAMEAVSALAILQDTLTHYIQGTLPEHFVLTDISADIYEVNEVKKKMVWSVKYPDGPSVKVAVHHKLPSETQSSTTMLTLSHGIDLVKYRALQALAVREPKVIVITWMESPQAMRYATIVDAGGDIGLWSGVYSNLHILN